jgi:membrane-associated protein
MIVQLLDLFRHMPEHLEIWAFHYGIGLYGILFLIIFAETGLVVTPFLPGDSLLFATGALLSLNLPNLYLVPMILVLLGAALLGDTVNFHVGRFMAPRLFKSNSAKWLNLRHLDRTREFYDRHGGKTIVLARFMPIIRTYAPFVSGLSGMKYARFFLFSFAGGAVWISSFLCMGYFFGNLPAVKSNFHYVILAIIVVSLAPVVLELVKARRAQA